MKSIDKLYSKIILAEDFSNTQKKFFPDKKIVFTNGCFDILHKGHIEYLSQASDFGDIFILGLNSDASVKRLKGKERPYQDESSRSLVLAALEFVDYLIVFHEDTPEKLIKIVLPNVLVKGGDYKAEEIVGYDTVKNHGGEVYCLDFVNGYSSSNIINKMK